MKGFFTSKGHQLKDKLLLRLTRFLQKGVFFPTISFLLKPILRRHWIRKPLGKQDFRDLESCSVSLSKKITRWILKLIIQAHECLRTSFYLSLSKCTQQDPLVLLGLFILRHCFSYLQGCQLVFCSPTVIYYMEVQAFSWCWCLVVRFFRQLCRFRWVPSVSLLVFLGLFAIHLLCLPHNWMSQLLHPVSLRAGLHWQQELPFLCKVIHSFHSLKW